MTGTNLRLGRATRFFLLSALIACCGTGRALATCNPLEGAGAVPCYMRVQPINVANVQNVGLPPMPTVVYSPFNPTSLTVDPTTAGLLPQTPTTFSPPTPDPALPPLSNIPSLIPNNSTSSNPIGFVVDPSTGSTPGQTGYSTGVDVTRVLLNNLGVDLVWLPMTQYVYNNNNPSISACPTSTPLSGAGSCVAAPQDFTTLNVKLASTNTNVANCTGFISGTTLTITSPCTAPPGSTASPTLAVYNFLTGIGISTNSDGTPAVFISGLGTGAGGKGTYTVNMSQTAGTSKRPISITATTSTLTSDLFKTLSQQGTTPLAISKGGTPLAPLGGAALLPPFSPPDPAIVNLFFVNTLNPPPAIGGTLYGLGWICNNGVAISSQTFAQSRPDTIAHELLHNLCLDHGTYGAGPWTVPNNGSSYAPPAGVVPTIPGTPLPGQCDSNYPACGANLMTTGIQRTEPTLACILAGMNGASVPTACIDASGNQKPGLFNPNPNLQTDRVTLSPVTTPNGATLLPVSQLGQVADGLDRGSSGLVSDNSPTLKFSGLLSPIPQETTKAQLETGGSSTDRAIFDLSGPSGGKPGETLRAWVLTLPREQSFGRHNGLHIVSQSRKDLVQDVKYYPGPENNPLRRNIDYQPGDKNADTPTIAAVDPSPCAFAAAECLVVKFQPPGLGADDSISFSNRILSGDAPITNEDLCKAKITYIFSDGYVTTSNFGRCPPVSLPLIANSWHPDPHVAPHVVPSNLLLAADGGSLGCTPVPGSNPPACPDVDQASLADSDALQEAGAPQQSCDNGATMNNPVTGIISGSNIIIQGGQTCRYQDCEFLGSLTINNATAYLKNCKVDGSLTMNSGKLFLSPQDNNSLATSVTVNGNILIGSKDSLPNSFSIGPGTFSHNLTIQNVPSGGLGYVCNSTFVGGVNVNNNASSIQIGEPMTLTNCGGNRISGGLSCKGNTATLIGGQNTITPSGGASGDCKGF